jgi:CRISPR-associated protein Csn2
MTKLTQWRILLSYKLLLEGIDSTIEIEKERSTSLAILNKTFFSRIIGSLTSDIDCSLENYAFYRDETEVEFRKEALLILSPFDLPFKDSKLLRSLFLKIEESVRLNDSILIKVNELSLALNEALEKANSNSNCKYDFGIEFDVKKYLKSFGYSSDIEDGFSLLDSLISFLNFIADVAPDQLLFFVNLSSFLENNDYLSFCKKVFSLKLTAFILDSQENGVNDKCLRNYTIDQHFILS